MSSRVKAGGRCSLFFGLLRTAASKAPVCSPDADAADSRQIYEGERRRLEQKVAPLAANGLSGPSIHRHAATAGRCRRNMYLQTSSISVSPVSVTFSKIRLIILVRVPQ